MPNFFAVIPVDLPVETFMPPECFIHLNRLAVYGWADDRNARQFKILHELA